MPSEARMRRWWSCSIWIVLHSGSQIIKDFISLSPKARDTLSSPLTRFLRTQPLACEMRLISSGRSGSWIEFSYSQLPLLRTTVAIESPRLATVSLPLRTRPIRQVAPSSLPSWRALYKNSWSTCLNTIKKEEKMLTCVYEGKSDKNRLWMPARAYGSY